MITISAVSIAASEPKPPILSGLDDVMVPLDNLTLQPLNPVRPLMAEPGKTAAVSNQSSHLDVMVELPSGSNFVWTPQFSESITQDISHWVLTGEART